jgi:hypothetical protein
MDTTANRIRSILILLWLALVAFGSLQSCKRSPAPSVTVTLRLSVSPADRADFVVGQANSAKLKYDVARLAGARPSFVKRLTIKPVPKSSLLEVKVGVETMKEAQQLVDAFVQVLQAACGNGVQLAVVEKTIR